MRSSTRAISMTMAARALTGLGTASAQAWTWAQSTAPLKVSRDGAYRGAGYGSLNSENLATARLISYLSDDRVDNMRTFVSVEGSGGGIQSGRRSDGGRTFARMADQTRSGLFPTTQSYYYLVSVCVDVPQALDSCSNGVGHDGL